MKNLIKLLTIISIATLSFQSQATECKWEWAIDVNHWRDSYQVPESRMIKVIGLVGDRYVMFDKRKIVLDTVDHPMDLVYKQSLKSVVNSAGFQYIGFVGKKYFKTLNGMSVERDVFEPVDMKLYWDSCGAKEGLDRLLTDKRRFKTN